jgi:glutaredoxin
MTARVVIYTIPGLCPLCDEARQVLEDVCPGYREVDIRTDRVLLRAYRNEIPVIEIDGIKRWIGRVNADDLRTALDGTP